MGKEEWKDRLNVFNTVRNAEYEGSRWGNPAEKWLEDEVVGRLTNLFGLDGVKGMRERNELRLTTPTDPATMLDSSAKVLDDPTVEKRRKGFRPRLPYYC